MAKMIISTTGLDKVTGSVVAFSPSSLFAYTETAAGGRKLFFRRSVVVIPAFLGLPRNCLSYGKSHLDVQWSTFDKQLAAGFRRHLTLEELSGEVKSKFMLWDGSRIITSCLVGLVSPGGHQNWAKLSTLNRMQRTQLFPL
ncbi:hypothetical protein T4D_12051 [Trichinella pseudospiralis]|uniref:Uncharacterized protein n=1 Tax=Trichinella pseudospiralis TaxID=6337 RepID=A0A0V1G202_TRIPS|nr:hypothetical protein T4D_12051 [Trichinella pseudospiralis]